ncbi:hypothetical protein [Amycolatopsis sp. NPDC051903]|uniref:hypothetical protein n=1 Tax=Amycolatopsis sp. NPDC051903 TaxID=3363936 RepID=UPI0037A69056
MSFSDPVQDQLDAARRTYPVGDHVTGVVTLIPCPGAIGLIVDRRLPATRRILLRLVWSRSRHRQHARQ